MSKLDLININKNYPTDGSNYSRCSGRSIEWIVIHYTGGVGTALQNAKFYQGANRGASAHYFVGHANENAQIYQGVDPKDKAWHCGSATGTYSCGCRNVNSIGVEVCCHNDTANKTAASLDWYFDDETVDRLVELVIALMKEYGIDADHIIRHYDVTHKTCPAMWVHDEAAWLAFKSRLTTEEAEEDMTGEEIYKKLNDYLSTLETPEWAKAELQEAIDAGITDGTYPMVLIPRYQAAIIAKRAKLG